jgi:hypothetical protein
LTRDEGCEHWFAAVAENSMAKPWNQMNADEKAEWLRAELRQMSSLYAMLASQIQETARSVKAIEKQLKESK